MVCVIRVKSMELQCCLTSLMLLLLVMTINRFKHTKLSHQPGLVCMVRLYAYEVLTEAVVTVSDKSERVE